ncbi:MAG: T9SS type A sorting domain-containing protein, partial [Saprospiraceae bacterium]
DAGATWDVVDGILPGLDSTSMKNLVRADAYTIQAKGDVVAIGVFSPFNDVALLKSTDNGNTWTRTVVHDFPIDLYDIDQGYTVDDLPPYDSTLSPNPIALYSNDGAGALAIDNDDMVHVFYGEMFLQDTNTTDGNWFYFPCTSGLAYWNENFGPDSIRTIADVEDLDGNGTFDVDCGTFDFGRYGISGLTSFPSAGVDPLNNIYLGYMAVMEGDEFYHPDDGQHNHHIYLMASTDGGENWTTPYDIVNEDILVEPELASLTETAYPHFAPLVDDKVHFIYQQDFRPGLSVIGDQDITEDNFINYAGVDVTLFGVTPTVEPAGAKPLHLSVMPNPASGMVRLMYDLPENAQVQVSFLDLLGKEALRANGLTGFEGLNMGAVNIGDLRPGVYFVRLKAGERTVVRKLVVK